MLILFVYSCSFSCVLLLSFKLLHSGNQKTHATKDLWLYIWGVKDRLSFLASLRPGLFCLTAPSRKLAGVCAKTSICKSVLYYLYVLDRHFEWLSLSFVLPNIPSPRTDLASGEHWPAITDHGVIRDLKIHENDWTNLNQKKKSGKIRECFFSFMLFSRERYTVIQSYPSIPTITHRRKPPQNRHRAVLQPLLMWAYHPGDRNDTELFFLLPSGRNNTWERVERKPALAFWLARGRVKLHLIHMAWLKHEAPQHQQLLSGHNFPIIKWTFLG